MVVMKMKKSQGNCVDKVLLKFFSDVLYLKRVICIEEYEAIVDSTSINDLESIFEGMMCDKFRDYRRGEMEWEMENGEKMNY